MSSVNLHLRISAHLSMHGFFLFFRGLDAGTAICRLLAFHRLLHLHWSLESSIPTVSESAKAIEGILETCGERGPLSSGDHIRVDNPRDLRDAVVISKTPWLIGPLLLVKEVYYKPQATHRRSSFRLSICLERASATSTCLTLSTTSI